MKRYFIETAKCGITDGGMACGPVSGHAVVTVQFKEDNVTRWLSLVEVEGIPNVYLSDKDIHDDLVAEDFDNKEFIAYMNDHFIYDFNGIEFGSDYSDAFESIAEDPENPAVPLVKYLIALVRCETSDEESLIKMASDKYADELDIPVSDVEENYLEDCEVIDEDFENDFPEDLDKESLYCIRLSLETDLDTESVFQDIAGDELKREEAQLQAVKTRCEDDFDYETWKEKYIADEYTKVKDQRFLTCKYIFAGIGQYETTIPEEQKESFICWIDGNGSAIYGGDREATEEEIKRFIALRAADYLK